MQNVYGELNLDTQQNLPILSWLKGFNCVWFFYSAARQRADADMVEEQQVQTEGEEAQYGMLEIDLQ